MPIDPTAMERLEGRVVRLTLDDGEVCEARIASVDTDDHTDVIYEVIRIIVPGRTAVHLPEDAFVCMPLAAIVRAEPMDHETIR
jgi:hypothetical protein